MALVVVLVLDRIDGGCRVVPRLPVAVRQDRLQVRDGVPPERVRQYAARLHPGHVRTLEEARGLGDALIVGINSDASVARLKGPGRPLIPERERAEILAAMECVDAVVIFDEDTPQRVIAGLLPDVLVKGGDWAADEIVGRAEVEAAGGRVQRVAVYEGYSTTDILKKAAASGDKPAGQS